MEKIIRTGRGLPFRSVWVAIPGLLLAISSMRGEQPKPTEYQVQAAYLYNFGRFIDWPARVTGTPQDAFVVCIFGQDPFGNILNTTVAGESIRGKSVAVRRISNPQDAVNCRILFIGSSEEERLHQILEVSDKASVLTVSDMPQFSQRGGMIQFVKEGSRIRFEINLTATQNAGLILSSELLKVAIIIRRKAASGS